MIKNIVNCKNCGAPLKYDNKARKATCTYCDSEYHMDNLGILEEYKIELEIYGKRMKFYISSIEITPNTIETTRLYDKDQVISTVGEPNIELTLINC